MGKIGTNVTSGTSDKIKGMADEAAGNIKQGFGKAVGIDEMQVKGKGQELEGEGQQALGTAKNAVKDTANAAADTASRKL